VKNSRIEEIITMTSIMAEKDRNIGKSEREKKGP